MSAFVRVLVVGEGCTRVSQIRVELAGQLFGFPSWLRHSLFDTEYTKLAGAQAPGILLSPPPISPWRPEHF